MNTDFWLDKITRKRVTSLIANKFAFGPKKAHYVQILLQKVEVLSAFRNKFLQPAKNWIVARQIWTWLVKRARYTFLLPVFTVLLPEK